MKVLHCFVLFVLLSGKLLAQEIEWGDQIKLQRSNSTIFFYNVDHTDGSFVAGITENRKFRAYEFDSTLAIVGNWEYKWQRGVQEMIVDVKRKGENLALLIEQKSVFGEITLLDVVVSPDYIDRKNELTVLRLRSGTSYDLRYQRSKDHWYLWYEVTDNRKSDPKTIYCHSFDKDWSEESSDTIVLPFMQREIDLIRLDIDTFGEYLIYARLFKGNSIEKRGGQPNYTYSVFSVHPDTTEPVQINLTSDTNYYSNMVFRRKGRVLYYYGTYGTRSSDEIEGVITGRADLRTPENVKIVACPLPDSIGPSELLGVDLLSKERKDFRLTDYIDRKGEVTFVLEKRYAIPSGTSGGRTLYEYHYRDLLLVKMDRNGLKWVKEIEKYQKTIGDGGRFSSYFMFDSQDTLQILYNDRFKAGFFGSRKFTNPATYSLRRIRIFSGGGSVTDELTNYKKVGYAIVLKRSRFMGNQTYLSYGQKNKTIKMCLIRF